MNFDHIALIQQLEHTLDNTPIIVRSEFVKGIEELLGEELELEVSEDTKDAVVDAVIAIQLHTELCEERVIPDLRELALGDLGETAVELLIKELREAITESEQAIDKLRTAILELGIDYGGRW